VQRCDQSLGPKELQQVSAIEVKRDISIDEKSEIYYFTKSIASQQELDLNKLS